MLSWKVIWDDINKHEIGTYDLFKSGYWERVARELKLALPSRKEWEDHFRRRLKSQYWCRSEYEVIVTPWPPHISIEELERLNEEVAAHEANYDHQLVRVVPNIEKAEKIDIFSQIEMNWGVFADYVWRNINEKIIETPEYSFECGM